MYIFEYMYTNESVQNTHSVVKCLDKYPFATKRNYILTGVQQEKVYDMYMIHNHRSGRPGVELQGSDVYIRPGMSHEVSHNSRTITVQVLQLQLHTPVDTTMYI